MSVNEILSLEIIASQAGKACKTTENYPKKDADSIHT